MGFEDKIRNEDELAGFIEELRSLSSKIQRLRLSLVKEKLELDQMYYEQKGNDRGVERSSRCLAIINERLRDLAAE